MSNNYDFAGWATKNDIRCSDGRIIRRDAFVQNDGQSVPLVWNHQHNNPDNVLGHALLENRNDGVYAYGYFNETESGKRAKEFVRHGDITHLSIYANQLKQKGGDVIHGNVREVSLVLAGANPGAYIDTVLSHGEYMDDEARIVFIEEPLELYHSNNKKDDEEVEVKEKEAEIKEVTEPKGQTSSESAEIKEVKESKDQTSDKTKEDNKMAENAKTPASGDDKTVQDVINTMNEEQKNVMYALIAEALNQKNGNDEGEKEDMKHNVFDSDMESQNYLTHSEMEEIMADGKRFGSLKESVLQHGIEDIDYLFPDAKNVTTEPEFIKRNTDWVSKVMSGTHHTPFARIKSTFANITADEARAKGYVKGNKKIEEVFTLLKRTTTPTMIYKKQKIDRQDVIDITDFDVVRWVKGEMRLMLDEEIARAILVGDQRISSSDDKISEQNIRPIWTDDDLYTIKASFTADPTNTSAMAKAFIQQAIRARKDYKGSGNPSLYVTEDMLTNCLLLEDKNERVIYDSVDKLATALRVKEIITVPVMENLTRTDSNSKTRTLEGIIVNLADYNVGADKGGEVSLFEDFDIDYNAEKYLIETRCSGALIKPYSAIAMEFIAVEG